MILRKDKEFIVSQIILVQVSLINVWASGILERLMRDKDRKRGERLRASEKLPPLVNYGSDDISSSSSSTVTDCAICLEDFVVGDSCQVFPVCEGESDIYLLYIFFAIDR